MGGIDISTQAVPRTPPVLITPSPAQASVPDDTQAMGQPAQTATPPPDASNHLVVDHGAVQATLDYDREYNQIVITLRQQDTGTVIQQFPPEQILKLLATFLGQQGGQMLDTKG